MTTLKAFPPSGGFALAANTGGVDDAESCLPSNSMTSSTASRVVPAMGETMARSVPVRALSRVDLPTLGRPMMATEVSNCSNSPWVRWQ